MRVQLAGRSPVIKHREVMRTARIRAGVVCGGPRKRRGGRRAGVTAREMEHFTAWKSRPITRGL